MASRLRSFVSPNVFLHVPEGRLDGVDAEVKIEQEDGRGSDSKLGTWASRKTRLVFFIPGNPGLIGYYRPFFAELVRNLDLHHHNDRRRQRRTIVAGMSLGGFEIQSHGQKQMKTNERLPMERTATSEDDGSEETITEEDELLYPHPHQSQRRRTLFSLQDQVELSFARLEALTDRIRRDGGGTQARASKNAVREQSEGSESESSIEVVLAGHSVGAYICLELVRLWHERQQQRADATTSEIPAWRPSTCILLTPTIQDIHLSPSGLIATPPLTYVSFLPSLAQMLVKSVLLKSLPASWLEGLVSKVTGMASGSHGLEATLAFLRSKRGVEQALYMAACEMKEIRADKWGEEVWGAAENVLPQGEDGRPDCVNPNLFFWFAKEDHWVARVSKDAILKARASGVVEGRDVIGDPLQGADGVETRMAPIEGGQQGPLFGESSRIRIQESEGLVHAWCLAQSEVVARRMCRWLDDQGD